MGRKRTKQSGTSFENRFKRYLESFGWKVVRSAGSGGPADLVAFHKLRTNALIIQCKASPVPSLGGAERIDLHTLNKFYHVDVLIVCRQSGPPWAFVYYAFKDPASLLDVVEEPAWLKTG
jgi:Holliday junction resolvase